MNSELLPQFESWLKENEKLFPPTNMAPNKTQMDAMFFWANEWDPKGNYRPTSCGRCYYNARAAIIKKLNIF